MSGFPQPNLTQTQAAPPSVPGSGVATANPYPRAALVTVYGGTVTSVAISGTIVGLLAGTFFVGAGQTITLVYAVAPTWTWATLP